MYIDNLIFKMKYLLQHCCRKTQSYQHKALLSSTGPNPLEKDSWSARRADRSCKRQARLHTVKFGLAEGRGPDCQPTCGVATGHFFNIWTPNILQTTHLRQLNISTLWHFDGQTLWHPNIFQRWHFAPQTLCCRDILALLKKRHSATQNTSPPRRFATHFLFA